MTTAAVASVPMDDPGFDLKIQASGDFMGWRSHAARKEPWTFRWLQTIGSGTLFDVGACVGSYSLMAAARGAKVIAMEPVPLNYQECVANARLNNLDITVLQCAVSRYGAGTAKLLTRPIAGYGLSSFQRSRLASSTQEIEVSTRSLDDIAKEYGWPTHIKVDVEGWELDVFGGASRVLDRVQSVICEIQDDYNENGVLCIANAHMLKSVWSGGRRTKDERTLIFERMN